MYSELGREAAGEGQETIAGRILKAEQPLAWDGKEAGLLGQGYSLREGGQR